LGVALDRFNKIDLEPILLDEAYALGEFHHTYMQQAESFSRELDSLKSGYIANLVTKLGKEVEQFQKDL
jgi:hypothetical protein